MGRQRYYHRQLYGLLMTHEMARALCDAGYMSVADYLKLCDQNGWAV
jgi:hypothetical protein